MALDPHLFYATVRRHFGPLSQEQVDALNALLVFVERDIDAGRITIPHAAYFLATAKHETADTYAPITERGGRLYCTRRYELNLRKRRELGNTRVGDGYRFRGRGYVQITGRSNYTAFGIADTPDAALVPETAWRIMRDGMLRGVFGRKLTEFVGVGQRDYVGARRSVNGTDRAQLIADYAHIFERALRGES
jgi:putative chitinase